MAKSIFDLLGDITFNKVAWREQIDIDRKQFSTYMVNRFLSMNLDYIELVNDLQQYTMAITPEQCYTVYLDILPKKKSYAKYISGKNSEKEKKYAKLIVFLQETLYINKEEAEDYIEILFEQDNGYETLTQHIKNYGYDEQRLQKVFNL